MSLTDTHKKLQQGQGFASLKLVDDFLLTGALPAIHNDMAVAMAMVPEARRRGAVDLGSCHGLLSVRAQSMGWSPVIGVETDAATVKVFDQFVSPRSNQVYAENVRLDVLGDMFEDWFLARCRGTINTVLARRAFPELFSDTYGKDGLEDATWRRAGARFTEVALAAGIEFIVLEGRKWQGYTNLKNPLYRADNEVMALGSGWREIGRRKECIVLERAA